ncbi:ester cyclase [Megasphaera sp.]|uniref:nuclear transport factor 2 family protein n=1 Tax=Megasphaera sp. TaxID=2023260 RepID=UPI001DB5C73F|nr:ester cyclase [Megasphaera sp.]MBS6103767.1 ester cyclase [Megasphaera sp.]
MNKKTLILSLSLAALSCLPLSSSLASGIPTFKSNKAMTEYFWNEVFNKHNTAVIDSMVGSDYKQHSPEFADGKAAFKTGVSDFLKAYPNSTAVVKHIGADGDLVFIHNHIKLDKNDRGQAAVDIFRIKDGKIVEHWDVIQDIPEKAANDNTMF